MTDPEEDFSFTYCGGDWEALDLRARSAIAAVAKSAYAVLKRAIEEENDASVIEDKQEASKRTVEEEKENNYER